MVYWTEAHVGARSQHFTMAQMGEALSFMNDLRTKDGVQFVTFVSQNEAQVGKAGVDSVKDGKTPDGQDYTWSKADRAGKMKRGQEGVPARDGRNL